MKPLSQPAVNTGKKRQQPILIIDGYHLLYKGFYGSLKRKRVAVSRDGTIINAIYTFVGKIYNLIDSNKYHTIIVAFDADQGSWRKDLYTKYKEKRKKTPEELIPQMQIIREFLTRAGIPWYEAPGFEGDDIIGTVARRANLIGYDVQILSNDKDTFQLVNPKTKVITCASKREKPVIVGEKEVMERFGCPPSQVPDIKALMGDQSDNIKGVKSLHYNTATDLLKTYQNVETIFENLDKLHPKVSSKLEASREQIFMNKKIATILCDMKMERIDFRHLNVNWRGYLSFLKKHKMWAFTENVLKKQGELASKTVDGNKAPGTAAVAPTNTVSTINGPRPLRPNRPFAQQAKKLD